jgi:hypothetical protein
MMSSADRKQVAFLHRDAAQCQLAYAWVLRDEVQQLWREANEAEVSGDVSVARHFAKAAGAKNEMLQQTLSLLPYEIEHRNVRLITGIARALRRGDEQTSDLVVDLAKLLTRMAEAARCDDNGLSVAVEDACNVLDQVMLDSDDNEDSEDDHE